MTKESGEWLLLFEEEVVERLRKRNPQAWMRLMRETERKRQEASADEGRGAAAEEPDDDRGGHQYYVHVEADEGRPIKVPTVPYVPTDRERRDHAVTHYPHRTWCAVCMAGRAVA